MPRPRRPSFNCFKMLTVRGAFVGVFLLAVSLASVRAQEAEDGANPLQQRVAELEKAVLQEKEQVIVLSGQLKAAELANTKWQEVESGLLGKLAAAEEKVKAAEEEKQEWAKEKTELLSMKQQLLTLVGTLHQKIEAAEKQAKAAEGELDRTKVELVEVQRSYEAYKANTGSMWAKVEAMLPPQAREALAGAATAVQGHLAVAMEQGGALVGKASAWASAQWEAHGPLVKKHAGVVYDTTAHYSRQASAKAQELLESETARGVLGKVNTVCVELERLAVTYVPGFGDLEHGTRALAVRCAVYGLLALPLVLVLLPLLASKKVQRRGPAPVPRRRRA